MRKIILIIAVIALAISNTKATDALAFFNYATFQSPGKGPYIETYLSFLGGNLAYAKNSKARFNANVEVSVLFLQADVIKASKKYTLTGPEVNDTAKTTLNFIDQQRFPLDNGTYQMELSITDKNKPGSKPFLSKQEITINYANDKVTVSDIELLESFKKSVSPSVLTKNGYDLVPYVANFIPENMTKLGVYAEVYNTKKLIGDSTKFLINYYIESYEKKVALQKYQKFATQKTNNVNVLLTEFDIKNLPTGNYNFVIDIRNDKNEKINDKKVFFQRYNPNAEIDMNELVALNITGTFVQKYTSTDTLKDYIRSLRPISTENEKVFADNQLKTASVELMQQYLYNFWVQRNTLNPEADWVKYNNEVKKVNKDFGTQTMRGYETDRGRVYLQYGAPDQRTISNTEPNVYPYEIWQYYKLAKQSNKKFVFYNQDLSTNNYTLLHSDVRGEILNQNWQMVLQKRTIQSNNMDMQKPGYDNFGNQVNDNFSNPR
jgi:GWxTD domain-containing protein